MDNYNFTINDNGVEYEYEIVRMVNIPNSKYQYIIYKDNSNEYFASRCEVNNTSLVLKEIEEDYEWEELDKIFQEVANEH